MKAAHTSKVWHIEASDKPEDQSYRRNLNVWVFARTLEVALGAFLNQYPGATVFKVIGDRWADDVIVIQGGAEDGGGMHGMDG